MLIDAFMEDCVMMVKAQLPDGIGGNVHEWQEGAAFQAAITDKTERELVIAEKKGVTGAYKVTFDETVPLTYHAVFRRLTDGQVFRVTSERMDSAPPSVATFHFAQVSAERWELA